MRELYFLEDFETIVGTILSTFVVTGKVCFTIIQPGFGP